MISPLKKCYQTAKLGFLLCIIVTLFTICEHSRGRKRGVYGLVPGSHELEYEAQTQDNKASIVPDLRDVGEAVDIANPEKENAMKGFISERIAYNRTLKPDMMKLDEQREKLQKIMRHEARSQMSVNEPRQYGSSVEATTQPRNDKVTQPPEDNSTRQQSKWGRAQSQKTRSKIRSNGNKKRRVKNRFMLKLIRSKDNKTEEHIEVDIYCRHALLYPNNTFVRDLVQLLNDHNIKVVNNGHIFEKNSVTDLVLNKLAVGKLTSSADDITSTPDKFANPSVATSPRPRTFLPPRLLRPPRPPPAEDVASLLSRITDKEQELRTLRLKSYSFLAVTEQLQEQMTEKVPIVRQFSLSSEQQFLQQAWTDYQPDEYLQMFEDKRANPSGGVKALLSVISDGESRHALNGSNTRRLEPGPDALNGSATEGCQRDDDHLKLVMSSKVTFNMADKLFGRTTVGLEQLTSSPTLLPPRLAPVQLPRSTLHHAAKKTFMRDIDSYSGEASSESRSYD